MFDKKMLIENIYYLTKQKNIKIGDLENDAKVSTGYFSRLAKDDNSSVPSIETMYIVSQKLDVSLDVLINFDFETLSETEKYILSFLSKLIKETTDNKIDWFSENYKEIYNNWINQGRDLNSGHPLMIVEADINDLNDGDRKLKYNSLFTDQTLELNNDVYWFKSFLTTFYIAKVDLIEYLGPFKLSNTIGYQYEMYAITKGNRKKICNFSRDTNAAINKLMVNLYDAVSIYCKRPKVADDVKFAIDCFMNESISKDNKQKW